MTAYNYKKEESNFGGKGIEEKGEARLPQTHIPLGDKQVTTLKIGDEVSITLVGTVKGLDGDNRWDGPGVEIALKKSTVATRGEDQDEIDGMLGD